LASLSSYFRRHSTQSAEDSLEECPPRLELLAELVSIRVGDLRMRFADIRPQREPASSRS